MKLMDRLSTLIKADAHGVVDSVEDRALLLKQHLREAETELLSKRARSEALDAEHKALAVQARQLEAKAAALDADIALALGEGKEDLARFAIKRLLPLRETSAELGRRRARIAEEREELAVTLEQQQQAYEELKARVRAALARIERGDDESGQAVAEPLVADEEVELELLRRKQALDEEAE